MANISGASLPTGFHNLNATLLGKEHSAPEHHPESPPSVLPSGQDVSTSFMPDSVKDGSEGRKRIFKYEESLEMLVQVAQGIQHMHSFQPTPIIHRDLKSENILLTAGDRRVRICDLGEARMMDKQKTMTMVGTNGYAAPEILRGERYTEKVDIYSFAIVMYELIFSVERYADLRSTAESGDGTTWAAISALVHREEDPLRPTLLFPIPRPLQIIITNSWSTNPKLRPSSKEIEKRLRNLLRKERKGVTKTTTVGEKEKLLPEDLIRIGNHFNSLLWSHLNHNFDRDLANEIIDANCAIQYNIETAGHVSLFDHIFPSTKID